LRTRLFTALFLGVSALCGCSPEAAPSGPPPASGSGGSATAGVAGSTAGVGGGATAGNGGTGAGTGGAAGASGTAAAATGGLAGASGGGGSGVAGVAGAAGGGGMAGGTAGGGSGGAAGVSGAGGDAGAAGVAGTSGMAGGGTAGAASGPCTATGLTFCTDFETQTVDTAPSSMGLGTHLNGDGTVTVDGATAAHSGTKSVRVNATGYQTFMKLTGAAVFPASGKMFVRVYIRLAEAMTGGHNTYFEAGLDAASDAPFETRVGVMNQMLMINQPDGDRGFLSNQNFYNDGLLGMVIPATTWTCVESYFDPPATTVDFWVEGTNVPDLHRTDWQQETYDALRFGYEKYAGPNTEIWYDDLAVGSERIGCFP